MPENQQLKLLEEAEHILKASQREDYIGRIRKIKKSNLKWLAGIIDCDGHITIKKPRKESHSYYAPEIGVASTSKELIAEIIRITGIGKLYQRRVSSNPARGQHF